MTMARLQYYQDSALLTKQIGQLEIEGQFLDTFLSSQGISLWNLIAPLLASHYLPEAIIRHEEPDLYGRAKICIQKRLKTPLRGIRQSIRESRKMEPTQLSRQAKILYLCFEPRHLYDFCPVLERMADIPVAVVGSRYRQNKTELLKSDQHVFGAVEAYWSPECASITRNRRRVFAERRPPFMSAIRNSKIAYHGASIAKLISHDLYDLCQCLFPRLIADIALAHHVTDAVGPELVVSCDDCNPVQRIYHYIAKAKGIPTLVVQQGFASAMTVDWQFFSADRIAALGEESRDVLTSMGVDEHCIDITGQPRFDRLVQLKGATRRTRTAHQIESGKHTVLFASQHNPGGCFESEKFRREMIRSIYEAFAIDSPFVLLVKPHPDESISYHRHLLRRYASNQVVLLGKDADITELICGTDALVTFHSTAGMEAMIAGKPVIVFDAHGRFTMTNYVHSGAAVGVSTTRQLRSVLANTFASEGPDEYQSRREAFVKHSAAGLDGNAAHRVLDIVKQMVKVA